MPLPTMVDSAGFPLAVMIDEPAWAPQSVFGAILTMRHQYDVFEELDRWGYWNAGSSDDLGHFEPLVERDRRVVKAARRWHGDPLMPPRSNNFVAGDVAAIRLGALTHDIAYRATARLERIEAGEEVNRGNPESRSIALDGMVKKWMYDATPYFLNTPSLVGLVDCNVPTDDELDEIRLPARSVAVYFGADLEVPQPLVDADDSFNQVAERSQAANEAAAIAEATEPGSGEVSADTSPPTVIPAPIVWIQRGRAPSVCGVVLHADEAGRLDDLVMWLVSCPGAEVPNRYAIYGRLSTSSLRYVALNLAAAIAWGQWTNPALDEPLPDPGDRRFRDVIRTSKFRKREPHGGAIGVKVLDVKRTFRVAKTDPVGTHASPTTHRRKGHRRRQRVGPRDDWHYEIRIISPVVINPGNESDLLTIRRLPPPP